MPATKVDRMFQTRIDLSPEVRKNVVDALNQRLADTLDLYTQTKNAHWNVKGMDFYQLHLLFDQLAEETFPFVDKIAERVTALGGYAAGTARMAASRSALPEYPGEAIDGRQHLEALIDRYARYAAGNRQTIDFAQNENDQDTQDLLIEIGRVADKHLWFLEAHTQSAVQKAG